MKNSIHGAWLSPIVGERAGLNGQDLFCRCTCETFGSLSEAAPSDKDQTDISDNPLSRGRESREKKEREERDGDKGKNTIIGRPTERNTRGLGANRTLLE